ncbi:Pycsar system effector family protein [Micromonospora sp. NPDC018662]|uniref:Pycsar system effector family protein n=1 Tax=Micromonospora sp. NPDC018662 TaxID=3364238 RepID=UPI00379C5832
MEHEEPWKVLQNVNEWLRHADTKASLVLTLDGALIGLIALRVQSREAFDRYPVATVLLLLALGLLAASLTATVLAVAPRTSVAGQQRSLLHFGHVGKRFATRESEFVAEFVALLADPDALRREVGGQVWANSIIGRRKYHHLSWGIRFAAGAILVIGLASAVGAFSG